MFEFLGGGNAETEQDTSNGENGALLADDADEEDEDEDALIAATESFDLSVQPVRMDRSTVPDDKPKSTEPDLPSHAELSETMDRCINLMDDASTQATIKLAGSKQDDLEEVMLQILTKHGIPPQLALYATNTAYSSADEILQGKVETLLQMASKMWHAGFIEEQKKKLHDAGAGNDTHLQVFREMTAAQTEVSKIMGKLQNEDKQELIASMFQRREDWQKTLAEIPPEDHNKYLLSMPAEERVKILKMQMILQMSAASEAQKKHDEAVSETSDKILAESASRKAKAQQDSGQ